MTDDTSSEENVLTRLSRLIQEMLEADETISTRAIMRHLPEDFGYPTAITRPTAVRAIYTAGRKSQQEFRAVNKRNKSSRAYLIARSQQQSERIAELEEKVELLTACVRAMYMALSEVGGTEAWRRFFSASRAALKKLTELKILPGKVVQMRDVPRSKPPTRSQRFNPVQRQRCRS